MKKQFTRMNATWVMALLLTLLFLSPISAQQSGTTVQQQNQSITAALVPKPVWNYFTTLCSIPRCSGNEAGVANLIMDLAKKNHLHAITDATHNVVVYLPGSSGFEKSPSICVQAHLDMVCQSKEKMDNIFPIRLIQEGDTIRATNTTLGADDGFGISALLTLMSHREIKHCPLELLFTTGEESGLTGAKSFNYGLLKSKTILNVDSEEEGTLTIGSAGGGVMQATIISKFAVSEKIGYECQLTISGLKGGHSGVDINRGRGNAIKIMAEILSKLKNFDLISISGGSAVNAIPRECEAKVFVSSDDYAVFVEDFLRAKNKVMTQFPDEKPNCFVGIISKDEVGKYRIMKKSDADRLLAIVNNFPNGVFSTEPTNKKLVRTSNNVGIINTGHDSVVIRTLFRSSSETQIDSVQKAIESVCFPEKTELLARLPSWEPNFDNKLVKLSISKYQELFSQKLDVVSTHGGLECAVFFQKIPDALIVSFGPTVVKAHSPDESVSISSVEKYWKFLLVMIQSKI